MRVQVVRSSRNLVGHAGLVAVGHCLNQFARLASAIDPALPVRSGIPTSDVVRAYVGLLAMGKSDFEAVENHRQDGFFKRALGLRAVPSTVTLRQRLDEVARALVPITDAQVIPLLQRARAEITALPMGHVALDIDVFGMDNSGSKKEGVSRTYAGYDGYAPIASYLGAEGWCLGLELREGSHHSARETHYTLERVLPRAMALTERALLVRLDSGFDSKTIKAEILAASAARQAAGGARIDLLVKWNPRANGAARVIDAAKTDAERVWTQPREGKRETVFSEAISCTVAGVAHPLTRIYRVIERRIDRHGQRLLLPEWSVEGWETSLTIDGTDIDPHTIIALYADHGTHEQFHSEFKSDMDLERLPSGKFDTNDAVLSLAALAYNCLRLIGQNALLAPGGPVRHSAKRRRLRTVMQEIIYLAASVSEHARRLVLGFAQHLRAFVAFERLVRDWRIEVT